MMAVGDEQFRQDVERLISAKTEQEEEIALGQLLTTARTHEIDYGYTVFDETRGKTILSTEVHEHVDQGARACRPRCTSMSTEVHEHLDDELVVTILIGAKSPHDEVIWRPKWNGHITRLVMP